LILNFYKTCFIQDTATNPNKINGHVANFDELLSKKDMENTEAFKIY